MAKVAWNGPKWRKTVENGWRCQKWSIMMGRWMGGSQPSPLPKCTFFSQAANLRFKLFCSFALLCKGIGVLFGTFGSRFLNCRLHDLLRLWTFANLVGGGGKAKAKTWHFLTLRNIQYRNTKKGTKLPNHLRHISCAATCQCQTVFCRPGDISPDFPAFIYLPPLV